MKVLYGFDSGYEIKPQLIFICEDDKHMVEVFKKIVSNKLEIPNTKIYFSTDLKQNSETLKDTLVEFKIDEKTEKYKMETVELKILE